MSIYVNLHHTPTTCIISAGATWITGAHDGTIKVWSAKTWKMLRAFVSHNSSLIQITTHPDDNNNTIVYSHSLDGRIFAWSLDSGEIVYRNCVPGFGEFKMSKVGQSRGLLARNDGAKIVTFGEYGVCTWDLNILCAPMVSFSDSVKRIELGYPLVSEYSGSGNNLAVQIGDFELCIMTNVGQKLATQRFQHEITDFAYQRTAEVLLVCVKGVKTC